jgi:hypothetical protein
MAESSHFHGNGHLSGASAANGAKGWPEGRITPWIKGLGTIATAKGAKKRRLIQRLVDERPETNGTQASLFKSDVDGRSRTHGYVDVG